jgi:Protein of unknown function (DUF3499)
MGGGVSPVVNPGSKWSTRYGTQYRRLCARPGCSSPAVATLRFQSTERLAWLVELDDNSARTQGDLCGRHASGLVLPRGWELHDERTLGSGGEAEPTRAAAAGSARRARARRKTGDPKAAAPTQLPGLEPEPVATTAEPATPRPEVEVDTVTAEAPIIADDEPTEAPTGTSRGVPAQFGTNEDTEVVDDELDEILDARTPLLRRAFRNAKPNERA